jgi:DNA processing protein
MDFPIIKINKSDKLYPQRLLQIAQPPQDLYCRGNLELMSKECLAVVGTRKLTPYGKEACSSITGGLAKSGFTIVSGLAMGIDAVAHKTTLENEGKTIAVLGGGIDDKSIGPKVNFPLAKEILKHDGLLLSEYGEGADIYPANFAARNRIVSGLSIGVLIIEADIDSGSLITARNALDQNRDVYAVPGSIFSSKSAGSNDLIKRGAKLVMSPSDIIEEYSHNASIFNRISERLSTEDPGQKLILDILNDKGELSIDEIISETKLISSEVLSSLSMLELTGLVKRQSYGKYVRV